MKKNPNLSNLIKLFRQSHLHKCILISVSTFIFQHSLVPFASGSSVPSHHHGQMIDYKLKVQELNRNDTTDFGSSFSGVTMSGKNLATWHESGYGQVRIWDITPAGKVVSRTSIKSPHVTHDRATFGCSLVMDGDFLGVGSYYTWRSNPHDGRFYVYDWKKNRKVSDFNPNPRSAQYFGMHSSISEDMVCVTQGGASHANWRVPAAYTFYTRNGLDLNQVYRFAHPGNASHASHLVSKGDYFASHVHAPFDSPHKYYLYLWKVQRDPAGNPIGVKVVDTISTNNLDTDPILGPMTFGEKMLFIGNSDGYVGMFKINSNDQLEYAGKLKPAQPAQAKGFGSSVLHHEDYLLVGAPEAANSTPGKGKVFMFKDLGSGKYQEEVSFYPASLKSGETFGDEIMGAENTLAISGGSKLVYFYQVDREIVPSQTSNPPKKVEPFIAWEKKFDNTINDVIHTAGDAWMVAGNSNEKISQTIKPIESGSSSASGGPEENVSKIALKHHTGKVTLKQWPMSAPDLFSVRHGNEMIYEKAYGSPDRAGQTISMKFGNSVPVTANTNGKSQTKGSGHPGNIDVIEFGKGTDKGNDSLSMEIIVNRSGQTRGGTKWDMGYLIDYDPIIEVDRSSADFFLAKINSTGQIEWSKTYVGNAKDVLNSMIATSDGGFLLLGSSSSDKSQDKSENSRGKEDFWLIKVDGAGNKLWDKTYGGTGKDEAVVIQAAQSGGYLLCGNSDSDKSHEKSETGSGGSNTDYWVVRIDEQGNILWDRTFNSSGADRFHSIDFSQDGGFVLAGDTKDATNRNQQGRDFWIVKIDENGKRVWDTILGGNGDEEFPEINQVNQGFRIVGTSDSNVSGDVTGEISGGRDQWMVTLDPNGQMISDQKFGKSGVSNAGYHAGLVKSGEAHWLTTYLDDRDHDTGLMRMNKVGDLVREKRLAYDFRAPKLALSQDHRQAILFGGKNSESTNQNILVKLRIDQLEQGEDSDDLKHGLVAHFPLNGDGKDLSGNENHADNYGATNSENRRGLEDQALQFQNKSYLTVKDGSKLNLSEAFTISAWIAPNGSTFPKIEQTYEKMWIVGKNRDITSGYHLFIGEGNTLVGSAVGKKDASISSFKLPTTSDWAHCVYSYDQQEGGVLYYNGKKVEESNAVGPIVCQDEVEGFSIGRHSTFNTYHFAGKIDEVRVYDRALSEVEVFVLSKFDESNTGGSGRRAPDLKEPNEVPGGFINYITLLEEVKRELAKQEQELVDLLKQGEGKEKTLKDLKAKLAKLDRECKAAEAGLRDCEQEGVRIRSEIANADKQILSRELQLIALGGELEGARKRLKDADCERQKIEERMEHLREEIKDSPNKLKTAHTPGWHYAPGYGWLWTSPKHYPQIYSNARQGWVYYEQGTMEPWLYYDYQLEQWEEWFLAAPLFSSNN